MVISNDPTLNLIIRIVIAVVGIPVILIMLLGAGLPLIYSLIAAVVPITMILLVTKNRKNTSHMDIQTQDQHCIKCGEQINQENTFCTKCGSRLNNTLNVKSSNSSKYVDIGKSKKIGAKTVIGIVIGILIISVSGYVWFTEISPEISRVTQLQEEIQNQPSYQEIINERYSSVKDCESVSGSSPPEIRERCMQVYKYSNP